MSEGAWSIRIEQSRPPGLTRGQLTLDPAEELQDRGIGQVQVASVDVVVAPGNLRLCGVRTRDGAPAARRRPTSPARR